MIHLYSMIQELKILILNKSEASAIDKCDDISRACKALLHEHGEHSDVGRRLNIIKTTAIELKKHLDRQDYNAAEDYVKAIFLTINKIGEILKLEFKEVES